MIDEVGWIFSYRRSGAGFGNLNLNPKLLKPWRNSSGYFVVTLMKDGKRCRKFVHKIMAETFLPVDPERSHVNHKNGTKDDNRLDNLEWSNKKENAEHAFRVLERYRPRGEDRYFAKLTEKSVVEIRRKYEAGIPMPALAKRFKVSKSTIRETVHRRAWKHVL